MKTILLVEDNPTDVTLIQYALDKGGIPNKLIIAENGEQALKDLFDAGQLDGQVLRQPPAVVLLNIKLPDMGGLEVLQRIRQHPQLHRQPVVILTGSQDEQDLIASYDLGANSYIRKPLDFSEFVETIQSLCLYWLTLNEDPPRAS